MQNDNSPGRQPCYALRVRSNFETFVLNHLEARGYSSFLPLYTAASGLTASKKVRFRCFQVISSVDFPSQTDCRFSPFPAS
jgi:hypothetical protein